EYGGWHVWIDTLSILYERITKEDYYRKVNKIVESMKDDDENEPKTPVTPRKLSDSHIPIDEQSVSTPTKSTSSRQVFKTNQLPPFTISEFKYSPMHIRLLHSVFDSIEVDIRLWRSSSDSTKSITEAINNPDNQIFCANHEIELLENTEGLSPKDASKIKKRVMSLSDLFILANTGNFSELEQEKSMPNGEILRQCLRLSMTTAVRHCMECRFQKFDSSKLSNSTLTQKETSNKDPLEILQELDVQRLRAIIYRDVVRPDRRKPNKKRCRCRDKSNILFLYIIIVLLYINDTKQSQFLALAIVYFVSVLMVSRYRDIIETNLSREASIISTTPSIRHGSTSEINVDPASINDSTSITNNQKNNGESAVIDDNNEINKINSIDMNNTSATDISYASITSIPTSESSTINKKRALSNIAPFLYDIFIEFSHILTKTLVGLHGQELLPSGLHALKQTASIVEFVMLLCSQEWQNSLQIINIQI
ncbi:unnamed protein product, partial [Rotaria sp. Silwood1]